MHASRNRIIALNLISFLGQGSLYMMNLAFVYYIRYTIGASALAVGAAGAVYNLTYLIGCLLLIPRLSSFRKSRLIIAAYAGMGLSIGLLMMTHSLPLIYLCLAAYGAFMSLVWPSVEGWLTEGLEGRLLNKVLGFFSFSWSFGVAVSPIAATFLSSSDPLHALVAGEILFAIIIAIVICISMKYGELPYVERSYGEEGNGRGNDRRRERIMGWIGATAVYFALFITLNIFPMHALEGLGISEEASGLVLSLRGFVSCVFFVVLSRVSWWQRSRKRILLSQILLLFSALMMAFSSSLPMIVISFAAFALLFPVLYSISAYFSAAGSEDKALTMRVHEAMLNLGSVLGCLTGGAVYGRAGYKALWLMTAAALLAAIAAEAMLFLRSPRERGAGTQDALRSR